MAPVPNRRAASHRRPDAPPRHRAIPPRTPEGADRGRSTPPHRWTPSGRRPPPGPHARRDRGGRAPGSRQRPSPVTLRSRIERRPFGIQPRRHEVECEFSGAAGVSLARSAGRRRAYELDRLIALDRQPDRSPAEHRGREQHPRRGPGPRGIGRADDRFVEAQSELQREAPARHLRRNPGAIRPPGGPRSRQGSVDETPKRRTATTRRRRPKGAAAGAPKRDPTDPARAGWRRRQPGHLVDGTHLHGSLSVGLAISRSIS